MPGKLITKMHIALLDHKLNLNEGGGSNLKTHQLALGILNAGHRATVITVSPALNSYAADLPYEVVHERVSDDYLRAHERLAVVRILRKYQDTVDVFQIEAPSLIFAGAIYRLLGGRTPVIGYLNSYTLFCCNLARIDDDCYMHCSLSDRIRHRPESLLKKTLLAPLRVVEDQAKKLVINKIDRFVAVSKNVAESYSSYGVDPRLIVTLAPTIIDLSALHRNSKNGTADPWGEGVQDRKVLRILYVGRLTVEKGIDLLIRAAATLDFPFEIRLIGDGPQREELERQAHDLGISPSVRFEGWIDNENLGPFYEAADILVHPGRWPEPSGRVMVEAMSFGLPLITSDAGATKSIALEAAVTFRSGDHQDLAHMIGQLRNNPQSTEKMSSEGILRAKEFDLSETMPKMMAVYEDLCGLTS